MIRFYGLFAHMKHKHGNNGDGFYEVAGSKCKKKKGTCENQMSCCVGGCGWPLTG